MSATEMPGPVPDDVEPALDLVLPGKANGAGAAFTWIGEGWRFFMRSPVMWIISLVVVVIIAVALNLIPIIGQVAFQILSPVLAAGWVVACHSLQREGEFELEHLFAGFKRHFGSLAMVGVIFLLLNLVLLLVMAVFFGFSIVAAMMAGDEERALAAMAASAGTLVIGGLVIAALFIPMLMAYWFAPALVVMHGMSPVAAMKASLTGCLRNFIPVVIIVIVFMVLGLIGALPIGLGLLVVFPMMIGASYAAYRAIFTAEPAEVPKRPGMVG